MPSRLAQPFFDPASESLRFLPEGPRQLRNSGRSGSLLGWVAIQHGVDAAEGSFNILDLDTLQNENHPMPGRPGFFAETKRPGVLLVGLERRLVFYDTASRRIEEIAPVTSDERCIINEGMAVPGGALFGTKNLTFDAPVAEVYFYDDASQTVKTLLGGQICSNGKHLYERGGVALLADIDSLRQTVARYRVGSGWSLAADGDVVSFAGQPVYPDGMRPSGESLIVAFYDPREVANGHARRFSIDTGELLDEWVLEGSPRVTCPEFVTIGGDTKLLFTTAIEGMPESIRRLAPRAGQLFLGDAEGLEIPPPPPLVAA